jgi:hypothetical protein
MWDVRESMPIAQPSIAGSLSAAPGVPIQPLPSHLRDTFTGLAVDTSIIASLSDQPECYGVGKDKSSVGRS